MRDFLFKEIRSFVDLGFVKTCDECVMYLANRTQHPILQLRILFQEIFNQRLNQIVCDF